MRGYYYHDAVPGMTPTVPASAADSDEPLRLADVWALGRLLGRRLARAARAQEVASLTDLLHAHLRGQVEGLEVIEESWPGFEHVNVQLALDAWLGEPGRDHELVGVIDLGHGSIRLADLLQPGMAHFRPRPGNVAYVNVPSGPRGQVVRAVRAGLYLVTEADSGVRAGVLVNLGDPDMGSDEIHVHVVADQPGVAAEIAAAVRTLAIRHNVFRGQVISFGGDMFERASVLQFHERRSLSSAELILPADVLAVIDRQVVQVARHRDRLLAARQHLKRGLLLYGPPGVGKTHTLRYLIGRLDAVTVLELTGESLGMISTACSVARSLQPAMVVVEDVDLIAEDRDEYSGSHPVLFELLNAMDGLAEDADVVFVLTTNRPETLEPALAARPGRVDQAVALDLPDLAARRQLFTLYQGALSVEESRLDSVLERTEGVTASFLKELLRRAALIAATDGAADPTAAEQAPLHVSADQLDGALDELLDTRNAMTRVLLGGRRSRDHHPADVPDAHC